MMHLLAAAVCAVAMFSADAHALLGDAQTDAGGEVMVVNGQVFIRCTGEVIALGNAKGLHGLATPKGARLRITNGVVHAECPK